MTRFVVGLVVAGDDDVTIILVLMYVMVMISVIIRGMIMLVELLINPVIDHCPMKQHRNRQSDRRQDGISFPSFTT